MDRSNKATLPLTVPRSHSSRLQRIQPRAYLMITIREQTATAFPPWQPSPPDLVHEQKLYFNSSQIVQEQKSSFLARILA